MSNQAANSSASCCAADTAPPPGGETFTPNLGLPNGVRVLLELPAAGSALQGVLQRDWVRPTLEAAP